MWKTPLRCIGRSGEGIGRRAGRDAPRSSAEALRNKGHITALPDHDEAGAGRRDPRSESAQPKQETREQPKKCKPHDHVKPSAHLTNRHRALAGLYNSALNV